MAVMRMHQTVGNQTVARLLGSQSSPSAAPLASRPSADEAPFTHTFADGRIVCLKPTQRKIQRKIGNRGKQGDWVWFKRDKSGVTESLRGKIDRITYAKGPLGLPKLVASAKHKNVVRAVDTYFVAMDENEYELERVRPGDAGWFLTPPSQRRGDDEKEEKEEKEDEGAFEDDPQAALVESSTMAGKAKSAVAQGKALYQAGKGVAGLASGMAGKVSYVETDFDTALAYTGKAASAIDKAGIVFPPFKAVTTPLSKAISAARLVRTAYHVKQLHRAGDAVPLTLGAFTEAQQALAEAKDELARSSDDDREDMLDHAAAGLAAMEALMRKTLYAGDEE